MSIKKQFGGQTIRKPGSYSKSKTDNSSGAQTQTTDVVFVVGESSKGAPGSVTGITEWDGSNLAGLIEMYGSGPIVDVAAAAIKPSKQQGIAGAGIIQVWKTNATLQASAQLKKSATNLIEVDDLAWGVDGNNLSMVVSAGSSGSQRQLQVAMIGGTTEALGQNPAQVAISIQYTGNGSACTAVISGASRDALTLVTTVTPAVSSPDASASQNILLKNYTMKTLVDFINAQVGYSASLVTNTSAAKKANELDPIASVSIVSAVNLLRLQQELVEVINTSKRVSAKLASTPAPGIPDIATSFLTGGAKGASANSDFSTGMSNSLAEDYNVLIPAISRDASEDIADAAQGFTDPASAYTIASVLVAQDTHLRLRSTTKNRKEAMGMAGIRKSSKAAAFAAISGVASEYMQVAMQDVLALDTTGSLRYMHPHVTAAYAAGMRTGMDVGEPLTHKFPNVQQIGHFINPATGLEAGDFNAGVDADAAIDAGVLFMEKAAGGFRWVVDNTTYGIDESFVYNRGSVFSASQFVFKTLRAVAENAFVGKKVSNGAAASIKSVVRNALRALNAPDVNIITSSSDAPEGFREDTFVVTIQGNTARVQVEFKPVQGLDFVFFDFTLGDISQSA